MSIFGAPNIDKMKARHDVKGLIKALEYRKSYYIIEQALKALGELGDARAVGPMIRILQDPGYYDFILPHVYSALVKIGTPAVDPLIKTLRREYPRRYLAIRILGEIGDTRAVVPLIQVLHETDGYNYDEAATALGLIGDQRAIEPLIPFLKHRSGSFRNAAAKALNRLGWQPVTTDEKMTFAIASENWEQCIAFGLAAVDPLIAILKDTHVSANAAIALGKIGDARAVEPIIPLLRYADVNIRCAAIEALDNFADTRAVIPLIDALRDQIENVRIKAANALGKISDPRAVQALVNLFQSDTSSAVREAVIRALGNIGDIHSMNVLIAIFNSKESFPIREAAAKALVQLYHSGKADADMKAKILELRERITTYHSDQYCAGHFDSTGTWVDFPL